jgi:predicted MPP superfamily phosphohydrolase
MPAETLNGPAEQNALPGLPESGTIFPDKKEAHIDFGRVTRFIKEAQSLNEDAEVGQEHATWNLQPKFPELPSMIVYMTDVHYGSIGVDYDRLSRHLDIVEHLPNTFLIMGGDGIDNFGVKHADAGIMGDAISPQMQAQTFMEKLKELDRSNKLGVICYGNHEDWQSLSGYDYYNTWMRDIKAPIFSHGGVLSIHAGNQEYNVGITHKHWGTSKLNLTNGPKRALEFSYPGTDIILTGHDHQASAELFSRAGERKLVIDGGTYKMNDPTGKKWGLGPAGEPGYAFFLWPDQKKFELVGNADSGKEIMRSLILLNFMQHKGKASHGRE